MHPPSYMQERGKAGPQVEHGTYQDDLLGEGLSMEQSFCCSCLSFIRWLIVMTMSTSLLKELGNFHTANSSFII